MRHLFLLTICCSICAGQTSQKDGLTRWKISDRDRPAPPVITPATPSTQQSPGKAPSDAVVLFDGTDLSKWQNNKGGPARWKVVNGAIEIVPGTGDIHTAQAFGDCQLHVEWAEPNPPHDKDQGRGNSGIYLMSTYELQVLDSYENKTYADGQAGAVYAQTPPLVNACLPPGQWQTYDIVFHGPRFAPDGKLLRPAHITVLQNGVLVQDSTELTGPTDYMKRPPYKPHPAKMPLLLQDHDQPVRFRNIWIRELSEWAKIKSPPVGWFRMNRILVIGATGNIGRQVLSQLPATGMQVRALARNPHTAGLPPHVDVVRGDLTVPETLDACLDGIDAVFLVWTAPPAVVAAALERIAKHARRIVFLSAPLKTPHPFFQQPNPSRALAEQIERLIETSGVQWTFLRPGMLAGNSLRWWAPRIRAGDVVRWPYLAAPTAPIDERDIAAVAVRALCEDGHAGAEYVLTGPQSLSQFEQISTIGSVIGRSLRIEEMSPDEASSEPLALMPAAVVNMLLDAWAAAMGQPAFVTSTIAEITGAPARTFRDWAADHAAEFRA